MVMIEAKIQGAKIEINSSQTDDQIQSFLEPTIYSREQR